MKKLLLVTFLLFFGFIANVYAAPYMLPAGEPIYFQFNNVEMLDQSLNNSLVIPGYKDPITGDAYTDTQGNWGVFNLSSIQDGAVAVENKDISGGTPLWTDSIPWPSGQTAGQIHGVFGGINLVSGTHATGGFMDLYWSENDGGADGYGEIVADPDLNGLSGPTAATVEKFSQGTFLARLNFEAGIIDGDDETTVFSDVNVLGLDPGSVNGGSFSYSSVDLDKVGLWTNLLDGNWFHVDTDGDGIFGEEGEKRDVRLSTILNDLAPDNQWTDLDNDILGIRSNDPGRVYTVIPEPNTIFLFGAGLLGLAGFLRRKED